MSVVELLKRALGTKTLTDYGRSGGGCINDGQGYMTESGPVFVKKNIKKQAKLMFDGEYEGLAALYATSTIRVPKPVKVVENPKGGALFAAEYVDMHHGNRFSAEFGTQLARLHLHNSEMLKSPEQRASWFKAPPDGFDIKPVAKFGFHTTTCCGYIPQDNSWSDNWVEFYTEKRLQHQVDLVMKDYNDKELEKLWSTLKPKIPQFFKDCPEIVPALLHGDLWGGNIAETDKEPIIFDPATFYGHSEFDFGIAMLFGGLSSQFFKAYEALIPRPPGFELRNDLYQLFHLLNHWNHFGTGYRGSTISMMKRLIGKV